MDNFFEEYKRKLIEEDERNRLSELQTKYNGIGTPNYANMSLRDELQTRFDLQELNKLQQKYGVQQTPVPQSTYTTPAQPTVQQPTSQPSAWNRFRQILNPISTANEKEYTGNPSAIDYSKYGEGFSKKYIDEMRNDTKFQHAFQRTSLNEGGYNNDPIDRGGQTNFGISQKWYPNEDIKNLTKERAQAIYYRDYWLQPNINKLPQELSSIVFDNGVIQGQSQAIKNLQRALDIEADGIIGPQTMEALHNLTDYNFIRERIKNNARNIEEQNQQIHPNQRKFYKGHIKRFNAY